MQVEKVFNCVLLLYIPAGLHTLGRCNRNISGYQGQWDSTPLGLDNHYFINMVGTGWFIQKMVTPMAKFLV